MADEVMLVVQSAVKNYNKENDFRTSKTALEQLSIEVARMLDRAQARAEDEGRSTIQARHI